MTIEGGITEGDIAEYLSNRPDFFERHAELLSAVQLTSPHGQRAVSLQERQMEMLREKIKGLEQTVMEMVRNGQANVAIAERLYRVTREILLTGTAVALPEVLQRALKHEFLIPQVALRLWSIDDSYEGLPFTLDVSEDTRSFAASLAAPYCGANVGFQAMTWLDDAPGVLSTALIPLRASPGMAPFGLLVLGSPDATRYTADMGTEFLARIGDVAAAGLSRLLPTG